MINLSQCVMNIEETWTGQWGIPGTSSLAKFNLMVVRNAFGEYTGQGAVFLQPINMRLSLQ